MDTLDVGTQAVLAAYAGLPPAQRQALDRLAETLGKNVNRKCNKARMGKQSALELIGKVGMLLAGPGPEVERAMQAARAAGPNAKRA
jgi:hypothetical protein